MTYFEKTKSIIIVIYSHFLVTNTKVSLLLLQFTQSLRLLAKILVDRGSSLHFRHHNQPKWTSTTAQQAFKESPDMTP